MPILADIMDLIVSYVKSDVQAQLPLITAVHDSGGVMQLVLLGQSFVCHDSLQVKGSSNMGTDGKPCEHRP